MSNYVTIHKNVPLPNNQGDLAMYTLVVTPSDDLAISNVNSYYDFQTQYQHEQTNSTELNFKTLRYKLDIQTIWYI